MEWSRVRLPRIFIDPKRRRRQEATQSRIKHMVSVAFHTGAMVYLGGSAPRCACSRANSWGKPVPGSRQVHSLQVGLPAPKLWKLHQQWNSWALSVHGWSGTAPTLSCNCTLRNRSAHNHPQPPTAINATMPCVLSGPVALNALLVLHSGPSCLFFPQSPQQAR